MDDEEFRPIEGHIGFYEISNLGRVRSLPRTVLTRIGTFRRVRGCILKHVPNHGYPTVTLAHPGQHRAYSVHRLVALAFLGERPAGMVIRHLDGDPKNCHVDNLAYGTVAENVADTSRHGHHKEALKTRCPSGHPYDLHNTYRDARGKRHCRPCNSAAVARSKARRQKTARQR